MEDLASRYNQLSLETPISSVPSVYKSDSQDTKALRSLQNSNRSNVWAKKHRWPPRTSSDSREYWNKAHYEAQEQENKRWPPPPIGDLVVNIEFKDLKIKKSLVPKAKISDVTVVGSLNLRGGSDPTLMIPGVHRKLDPPRTRRVPQDAGRHLRNVNSACYPKHPMEPAVLASLLLNADAIREKPPHIVASVGAFGGLLATLSQKLYSFRILAQEIDGTLFLCDHKNSPFQELTNIRGYGSNFVRCFTSRDESAPPANIYERALSYQFGRHRVHIHYDSDAYIDEFQDLKSINDNFIDDLSDPRYKAESAATFRRSKAMTVYPPEIPPEKYPSHLNIEKVGTEVEQSSTIEIMTQSTLNNPGLSMIQLEGHSLWVKQTGKFLGAYHTLGRFHTFTWFDLQPRTREWEHRNAGILALFDQLLLEIRRAVAKAPDKRAELIFEDNGQGLQVMSQTDEVGEVLSEKTRHLWTAEVSHDEKELGLAEEEEDYGQEEEYVRWTTSTLLTTFDPRPTREEHVDLDMIAPDHRKNTYQPPRTSFNDRGPGKFQERHPKTLSNWKVNQQSLQEKDKREEKHHGSWNQNKGPEGRADLSRNWRGNKSSERSAALSRNWREQCASIQPATVWKSGWSEESDLATELDSREG